MAKTKMTGLGGKDEATDPLPKKVRISIISVFSLILA
jgi:hypothetical protein